LGSFFAGVKAGTLSGILFVGVLAAFNVAMLYAFKPEVLTAIQQLNPVACPTVPVNGTSVEDCFASVVAVDVPFRAFVAFFVVLFYAGVFGMYYDSLPSRSPTIKGETIAAITGANLVFFGFSGYVFDFGSATATAVFLVLWTPVFGYFLGRLYKKYTRRVGFESEDPGLLRVVVDRRDLTGQEKTFAYTSSHKVRADLSSDASFKEWIVSGGITLEDSRSFETAMEITGDGALKGSVGKKY
jgi:hypothetical protein